jgi:hypothetical protein
MAQPSKEVSRKASLITILVLVCSVAALLVGLFVFRTLRSNSLDNKPFDKNSGVRSGESVVVRGAVEDPTGRPIANARINVIGPNVQASTDENGMFAIQIPDTPNGSTIHL